MRYDCNKPHPKSLWHRKFALFPVEIRPHVCVWLEYYWRRGQEFKGYGPGGIHCSWRWLLNLDEDGPGNNELTWDEERGARATDEKLF